MRRQHSRGRPVDQLSTIRTPLLPSLDERPDESSADLRSGRGDQCPIELVEREAGIAAPTMSTFSRAKAHGDGPMPDSIIGGEVGARHPDRPHRHGEPGNNRWDLNGGASMAPLPLPLREALSTLRQAYPHRHVRPPRSADAARRNSPELLMDPSTTTTQHFEHDSPDSARRRSAALTTASDSASDIVRSGTRKARRLLIAGENAGLTSLVY